MIKILGPNSLIGPSVLDATVLIKDFSCSVVSAGYKDVQNCNLLSRNLQHLFEQSSVAKRGQLI
jgi:hypothetical protein